KPECSSCRQQNHIKYQKAPDLQLGLFIRGIFKYVAHKTPNPLRFPTLMRISLIVTGRFDST
ncbi:MAG TPA: hypothetical protein VN259_04705, partial [Xanthomonadales bacterium]|nr:hypothetical protein [Xanthomonadales bacterium]